MTPLRSHRLWLWGGLLGLLLAGGARPVPAQSPGPGVGTAWTYGATLSATGAPGGALPFWLHANQYGTVDPASANAGLRLHARRSFRRTSGLDYAAGVDLLGRLSNRSTAYVHELYGRLRYGRFQLTAGRREQVIGRVDTTLSLGGTTWGTNATPPPKISVSSDGYLGVPGTDGVLAVKGYLAHGWLEDDRFVEGALLHEKYGYLRIRLPTLPVTAHAGLTHHALWGGTHPQRGPLPEGLRDWAYVVAGQSQTTDEGIRQTGVNQLASYDFGLDVTAQGVRARAYRQFYHEDVPSLRFRNPWDGLWGVSLRRTDASGLVTGLLWEHLRMTRQNAKFSEGQERGEDTYYHHTVYRGGWTYEGRTLGTPLITTPATTPGIDDRIPGIANSIVLAHHVGLEGRLPAELAYRLLGTYSRNYGAQGVCGSAACTSRVDRRTARTDQYSVRIELRGPLLGRRDLRFRSAVAFDVGDFYENRMGLTLRLTWRGP